MYSGVPRTRRWRDPGAVGLRVFAMPDGDINVVPLTPQRGKIAPLRQWPRCVNAEAADVGSARRWKSLTPHPSTRARISARANHVESLLGSARHGQVYKARDRELDRIVAIKVLRPDLMNRRAGLAALQARIAAGQQHLSPQYSSDSRLGEYNGVKLH